VLIEYLFFSSGEVAVHQHRIVWEDEAKAREVEVLVHYTVLGDLVQIGAIRPTKVTLRGAKKPARELPIWTATGRRLLRRAFLQNHMGYVALQSEIQNVHDRRVAA
jgi:hypothetical protein